MIFLLSFLIILSSTFTAHAGTPPQEENEPIPSAKSSRFETLQQKSLNKNLTQALQSKSKYQYALAIKQLDSFIGVNDHLSQAFFERGICHYRLAQYKNAVADFNKAIDLDPKYIDAYIWLLSTEQQRNWRFDGAKYNQDNIDTAFKKLEQGLRISPNSRDLLLMRISFYENKDDLAQVASLTEQARRLYPNDFLIEKKRICCLAKQNNKQLKGLLQDLNRRIKAQPNSVDAFYLRALVHAVGKNDMAARNDYKTAIALAPNRKDLLLDAALFEDAQMHDLNKSLSLLESFRGENPNAEELAGLHLKAKLETAEKHYPESIADASKLLSLSSTPEVLLLRATAYGKNKQVREAINDITRYLDLIPNDANALGLLSFSKGTLGLYKEGLGDANRAIQLAPQNKLLYGPRAIIYSAIGSQQEAIKDYRIYLQGFPQDESAHETLAFLLAAHNQFPEALHWASAAIKLNPKHIAPRIISIRSLYALKRDKEAAAELQKLRALKNLSAVEHRERGILFRSLHLTQYALDDFRAASDKGDFPAANIQLTETLISADRKKEALDEAKLLYKKAPTNCLVLASLSQCYQENHNLQQALQYLNQAIILKPNDASYYFHRAQIHIYMRNGKDALADINQSIKLTPSVRTYGLRAEIYRNLLNRNDLAKQDRDTIRRLKSK